MLLLSEQRHENMDQAIQLLRAQVLPGDVILTDHATSFQLRHYLCKDRTAPVQPEADGGEWYQCDGFRVLSAGSPYEALTAENVAAQQTTLREFNRVWVVQGGWAKGLGEAMRSRFPAFSATEIHSFGHYLEIFQSPPPPQITEPRTHSSGGRFSIPFPRIHCRSGGRMRPPYVICSRVYNGPRFHAQQEADLSRDPQKT